MCMHRSDGAFTPLQTTPPDKSETVNNSTQLCFSFPFFEVFCTNKLLIYKKEHDLVASKFPICNFIMCIVK